MSTLSDKLKSIGQTIKPYAIPAALAGAGGGALMGHMAAKNRVAGETSQQRRHRIIRNAVLGLTLGGVAGAAAPAGAKLLSGGDTGGGFHPIGAAAGASLSHWAPTTAGIGGGALALRQLGKNRRQAASIIGNAIHPPNNVMGGGNSAMEDNLMLGAQSPKGQNEMMGGLSRIISGIKDKEPGEGSAASSWKAKELMGEAGLHSPGLSELSGMSYGNAVSGLRDHLRSTGLVSKLMSHAVQKDPEAPLTAGTRAAEMFSRYIRPSVSRTLGWEGPRLGVAPLAGLVGGGMLGANYLQQKLQGD